jgi:hypothetical protein
MDHSEVLEKQGDSVVNRPWRRAGDARRRRSYRNDGPMALAAARLGHMVEIEGK